MKHVRGTALGLACLLLAGCGAATSTTTSSDDDSGVTTVGNPSGSSTAFYDAVVQVMPVFDRANATPAVSKTVPTSWSVGNPLYEAFYLLQEFNPDTDQGVIDTSNLYKTMWEGRNFFSNAKSECTSVTEQIIASPFDFGTTALTYNCAMNNEGADGYDFGGAIKELDATGAIVPITATSRTSFAAPVQHGVFGFVWADDHNEYGAFQGTYSAVTDDLALDIAVWVDYTGDNDYCYRNDIDGNVATHLFTFRAVKGNLVAGTSSVAMVGKGYSQGTDQFFLLKITSSGLDGARYYCIGADAGETELMAMDAAGTATVDANCAAFQADVDALTLFTSADLACSSAAFNSGGTGTTAEGTVFLDFE
ncbi:MAG: hypothetical protein HY696_08380 [Deltaproteobacteria bacterium]|nr:hypothetical protein [Deltaproteobacteria bacterium]